ncbi:chaplin family protein [Actinomadura napierensis]|uniref:Chaplin domain-containing protein n=1 Tax=Actinomadura napierensis TaxID=267854 RepID=A0ABP5KLL4_9ACTN
MFKKLAATGILGFAVAGSVLAAAPAYAGGHGHGHGHGQFNGNQTSGNGSILGGNQVNAPISIPIDVCGNAVAVIGIAGAGCKGGASVHNG